MIRKLGKLLAFLIVCLLGDDLLGSEPVRLFVKEFRLGCSGKR
jgi:hypothetical protein